MSQTPGTTVRARILQVFLAGIIGVAFLGFIQGVGSTDGRQGWISEEEGNEVHGEVEPPPSYWELLLSPRGASSGLEHDLAALRGEGPDVYAPEDFKGNLAFADWEVRPARRAYDGAPPTIPHPIRQNSVPECLTCHEKGLHIRGRFAPAMGHRELTNCTQCHVPQTGGPPGGNTLPPDPRAVDNAFIGRDSPIVGEGVWDKVPPRIPHDPSMRDRCESCHGQRGSVEGHHPVGNVPDRTLPDFFPLGPKGELQCRTCHTSYADAPHDGPPNARDLGGHDLCSACHDGAHEIVLEEENASEGGHPVGAELSKILRDRPGVEGRGPAELSKGCPSCHTLHGASAASVKKTGVAGVCGVCHENKLDRSASHPLGAEAQPEHNIPKSVPLATDGSTMCRSCHNLSGGRGPLLRSVKGELACLTCHDDKAAAAGEEGHGKVPQRHGSTCLGCHAPHDAPVPDTKLLIGAESARKGDPNGCLHCHGPGGVAAKAGVSPGRRGHPVDGRWRNDVHLVCQTCHEAHAPAPDAPCTRCHADRVATLKRGGHGNAVCEDCHNMHSGSRLASLGPKFNVRSRRCLACHQNGVGGAPKVPPFQHVDLRFPKDRGRLQQLAGMRLFGKDGRQLPPNVVGDITCSTCHRTHGPEAQDVLSKMRISGVMDACQVCHGDDIEMRYKFVHQPQKREELEVWE